jgi:ABC-2 type transport system ATP-binding protein
VTGLDAPRIGEIAAANRIVLHELAPQLGSLEEAFMEMTASSVEYGGNTSAVPPPASPSPFTAASTASPGDSE